MKRVYGHRSLGSLKTVAPPGAHIGRLKALKSPAEKKWVSSCLSKHVPNLFGLRFFEWGISYQYCLRDTFWEILLNIVIDNVSP